MLFELHGWATAVVYPLVDSFAAWWLFASYREDRRAALRFLGCAAAFSAAIAWIWLGLRCEKALGTQLIPVTARHGLWLLQALVEYLSIVAYLIGVILIRTGETTAPQLKHRDDVA